MAKKLNEKQIAAIALLARPKLGGLTLKQVADEVGIAESTLYEWRKDDIFQRELKREIVRRTHDRLPEVIASMSDEVINNGNAAMAKLLFQLNDMLVDKTEVKTNDTEGDADVKELLAKLQRGSDTENSDA